MDPLLTGIGGHPFWIWMGVAAVFLVIEIVTGSGWMLWPAAAAAIVAVAGRLIVLPVEGQVALFAVVTVIATYVGRRLMPRPAPAGTDINDPLLRLVGHRGEAAAPFAGPLGRVFVDGKEWSAELEGGGPLEAGSQVEVVAVVGGARLKVRAV